MAPNRQEEKQHNREGFENRQADKLEQSGSGRGTIGPDSRDSSKYAQTMAERHGITKDQERQTEKGRLALARLKKIAYDVVRSTSAAGPSRIIPLPRPNERIAAPFEGRTTRPRGETKKSDSQSNSALQPRVMVDCPDGYVMCAGVKPGVFEAVAAREIGPPDENLPFECKIYKREPESHTTGNLAKPPCEKKY